jgi:REP element-mobilizing transposase RayT
MRPEDPFAVFITWTCYGTWVPGDPRGYVSETWRPNGKTEPKENIPQTPFRADDAYTRRVALNRQKHAMVLLTARQALVVAESLVDAADERQWRSVRGAIMRNHVHVVVMECPDNGPMVRRILKGVSQARLSQDAGHARRWWTHRGSNRYLHDDYPIEGAIKYTSEQHGMLVEIRNMDVFPKQK